MIDYYDADPSRDYTQDFETRFGMYKSEEDRLNDFIDEESRKEQEWSELWFKAMGVCCPEEDTPEEYDYQNPLDINETGISAEKRGRDIHISTKEVKGR